MVAKSKIEARKSAKRFRAVKGVILKPTEYQPSKAEIEADARLPATFDRAVDALFSMQPQDRPLRGNE